MKKRIKNSNKKSIMYKMIPCLILLIIISLSIGYSAFSSKLNISKTVVHVRLKESIRITGLSVSEVSNNAISNYNEYNKENINAEVYLPEKTSTVTYKVEVTNFGNMEMGILNITGLPDNLDYEITDYKLGTKICDDENQCKLGISKEFYITLKYKEDSIVSENELENHYDLKLDFDFKQAFNVIYEGIEVNDYPTSILKTGTLEVNFGENSPSKLKILVDGLEITDYTYENGILKVPNVMSDITIKHIDKVYLMKLSTYGVYFKDNTFWKNVKTISFVHYVDVPSDKLAVYDLSENQDGIITGWIDKDYNLYIGSEYNIYAKNLSNIFYEMSGVTSVSFENLNTSETTNMSGMFDGMSSLTSLDLTSFDTSKVTNMSNMFYNTTSLNEVLVSKEKWIIGTSTTTTNWFSGSKISDVTYVSETN